VEEPLADQDRRIKLLGGSILVGVCLLFVALAGRLVHINASPSPTLASLVHAQRIGSTTIAARRGSILDAQGRVVAGTRLRPSAFADPSAIVDVAETARRLAPILDLPAGHIEQTLTTDRSRRFCWLKRWMDPVDASSIRRLGLAGIYLRDESERYYPLESLMAQTVGIVGREGRGLEGLELLYNAHLTGASGRQVSVYDGRRERPIWVRSDLSTRPRDGGHVVLTLDSVIQGFVETHLAEAVAKFEAAFGVAVVMSPRTGDVLAIAQVPTFDPNRYGAWGPQVRRNRVVCDAHEPGSIFKPFVAAGALSARVVEKGEMFDCGPGERYFGRRLMHDSSPRGVIPFEDVIAKSSNIGMGIIGERMGNRMIHDVVRSFGFGEATGVKFPGESRGIVRPLSQWSRYSMTSLPIGQEIGVTALQMVTAFSAIVNGGQLLRPRLVRALLDSEGEVMESFEGPVVVRRVLPERVAGYMTREVLVGVVERGGGRAAALADWQMLGKTGTAQVAYADQPGYEPDAYIGSFIGAAPAADPRVVALVMIHRPQASLGYYGTKVAAPAVGRIMGRTLAYLGVAGETRSPAGRR